MQVILLEKITHLGNLGDIVKVKDGYGRNFLIPTGRAKRATKAAIAEFEARRAELEKAQAERIAAAQALADKLNGVEITIASKSFRWRRSPNKPTSFRHERRHRRSGRRPRLPDQEVPGPHAARRDQVHRRLPDHDRSRHGHHRRHYRQGCGRSLIGSLRRSSKKGFSPSGANPFCFWLRLTAPPRRGEIRPLCYNLFPNPFFGDPIDA